MNTRAAASAAATTAGGSSPSTERGSITAVHRLGAPGSGGLAQGVAQRARGAVDHDHDVLARP